MNSWKLLSEKSSHKDLAPDPKEGLSWDTDGFKTPQSLVPLVIPDPTNPGISNSSNTPTSQYMTGSVAVGIVIVSGPGHLKFTDAEKQKVVSEVQEGLQFLATAEPRAKLVFHYDIQPVAVTVAGGNTSSYEKAEAPWRNAALAKMGYAATRQGSIQYVNSLKQSKGTDWAYVAYFTKYDLFHFAYAVDEKLVMSYENDGWGIDNINKVFAHETCHIFGAADEYGACNCNSIHGYLSIANGNCKICAPQHVPCLMEGNVLVLCDWSRRQIGWDASLFPH